MNVHARLRLRLDAHVTAAWTAEKLRVAPVVCFGYCTQWTEKESVSLLNVCVSHGQLGSIHMMGALRHFSAAHRGSPIAKLRPTQVNK